MDKSVQQRTTNGKGLYGLFRPKAKDGCWPAIDAERWIELVSSSGLRGPARELAAHTCFIDWSGGVLRLSLSKADEHLKGPALRKMLADSIARQIGCDLELSIEIDDEPIGPAKDAIQNILHGLLARSPDGYVTIAPGIARRILTEANFIGQRRVTRARVDMHSRRIKSGRWDERLSTITIAQTPDGKLHNINGQHRLTGSDETDTAIRTKLEIVQASDMEDVGRLYAAFDDPRTVRTDSDVLSATGAADKIGVPRKIANSYFQSLTLLRSDLEPMGNQDFRTNARDRDGRIEDIPVWAIQLRQYAELISKADKFISSRMLSQGVMASALYTLKYQPKIAAEFWGGLAANDGLRRNDPRSRLLADFQNRHTNVGSIRQKVQRVAVAWNAFYFNRDISSIRCVDAAKIVFAGTPKGKK